MVKEEGTSSRINYQAKEDEDNGTVKETRRATMGTQ